MSMYQWFVIGISGVTCGGKTSLTLRLKDLLIQHFQCKKQNVKVLKISQDDYFLQPDDSRHVLLPSLGHNNWELPTAVDLDGMYSTALNIITVNDGAGSNKHSVAAKIDAPITNTKVLLKGVLLIEGFLVLNHSPTSSLCHLGYYILLSRATCMSRRSLRSYDPPDVPGYFEECVWPEHLIRRADIFGRGKIVDESDPLSMKEIHEGERGTTDSYFATKSPIALNNQHHTSQVESEVTTLTNVSLENNCTAEQRKFYMRLGGNVLPIANFGKAGLGLVKKVRILNGGATDIEDIVSSVFKDVVNEMERLKFE